MAQVSSSVPSARRLRRQMPAKAKGWPEPRATKNGREGPVAGLLPFVEAGGRDQAAALLEAVAEHGLLGHGLAAHVDLAGGVVGFLHPGAEQAPAGEPGLAGAVPAGADDRDLAVGGDVPARARPSGGSQAKACWNCCGSMESAKRPHMSVVRVWVERRQHLGRDRLDRAVGGGAAPGDAGGVDALGLAADDGASASEASPVRRVTRSTAMARGSRARCHRRGRAGRPRRRRWRRAGRDGRRRRPRSPSGRRRGRWRHGRRWWQRRGWRRRVRRLRAGGGRWGCGRTGPCGRRRCAGSPHPGLDRAGPGPELERGWSCRCRSRHRWRGGWEAAGRGNGWPGRGSGVARQVGVGVAHCGEAQDLGADCSAQ